MFLIFTPFTVTVPSSVLKNLANRFTRVVFPLPLFPTKATISPAFTFKFIFFNT